MVCLAIVHLYKTQYMVITRKEALSFLNNVSLRAFDAISYFETECSLKQRLDRLIRFEILAVQAIMGLCGNGRYPKRRMQV